MNEKKQSVQVTADNNPSPDIADKIKVSVIVPVYKDEKYIERCLYSLLNQSLKEMEFIFIDDCGGDNAISIVEKEAASDNRIQIIYNEKNIGAGLSRNRGIELAHGEYLGFVDADDEVDLNFYEKLYALALKYNSDVSKGQRLNYLLNGTKQKGLLTDSLSEFGEYAERQDWFYYFYFEHQTAIYRRDLIKKENIRYSNTIVAEDTMFLLQMMYYAHKVSFCHDAYYHYYIRKGSLSTTRSESFYEANIQNFNERIKFLCDHPAAKDVVVKYIQWLTDHLLTLYQSISGTDNNHIRYNYLCGIENALEHFIYKDQISEHFNKITEYKNALVQVQSECNRKERDMSNNPRRFFPEEEFFVIDSNNLSNVKSRLYGFCTIDGKVITNYDDLQEKMPGSEGAYIYIKRSGNHIMIKQDYVGCYGLYIYQNGYYWAISNSFVFLVDYIKTKNKITFNDDYANYFITADLCSFSCKETMINEISVIDRSAIINIEIDERSINYSLTNYNEETVELESEEGIQLIDDWFNRWKDILRNLYENDEDIIFDLSGGFDSRITFILAAASGIDLEKIYVKSVNDKLHTHTEDFEIASEIADYYKFSLNNNNNISQLVTPFCAADVIDISLYLKECFHKQMYFKYGHYEKRRFVFTGNGGECIKNMQSSYWPNNYADFLVSAQKRVKRIPFPFSIDVDKSIERVVEKSFSNAKEKFSFFRIGDIDQRKLSTAVYRESRNRNHFGKQAVEYFFSNVYCMSPLLDENLNKIRPISNSECEGLLYAVLLDRYCPKLLEFDFEGQRKFKEKTLQKAKQINEKFKFQPVNDDYCPKANVRTERNVNQKAANMLGIKHISDIFWGNYCSEKIKNLFIKHYNLDVYNFICEDAKKRKYFPLTDIYTALGICKILEDVSINNSIMYTISERMLQISDDEEKNTLSLRDNWLVKDYITGRVDIKNTGYGNDISILDISDKNSHIITPEWYSKNGKGYIITSEAGKFKIVFKCLKPGKLFITLRSMDIQNKRGERIPLMIDFNKMVVNNETVFEQIQTIHHDKPYKYSFDVSDGEVVSLYLEWLPYNRRN